MQINIENLNEFRNQLSEKYLTQPFFNSLDTEGIKILTAPTGFGKTYSIWNKMSVGYLQNHGDIHLHVAPHIETIDKNEIDSYLSPITSVNTFIIHNGEDINFKDIRYALLDGYKIVMILSDQRLMSLTEDGSPLLQLVRDYTGRVLLTRDELSYGTTSKKENYKNDKGHDNKKYRGTFIKNLHKLHLCGANTYGFTATPTREHLGELESMIAKKFTIVNNWPTSEEMLPFQKWYNIVETSEYDDTMYNNLDIPKRELRYISNTIHQKEQHLKLLLEDVGIQEENTKFTGLLSVQTDYRKAKNPRVTINLILGLLKENPTLIHQDQTIIIPTYNGWKEYDHRGNETGKEGDDNEWLDIMNDPQSSARIMVVIYKGNYGVNIPTLSVGVAMRNPRAKAHDTRENIIMSGLQVLGRLNRTNLTGEGWETFNKIYQNKGKMKALEYLMVKNTFDFRGPDGKNLHWDDVFDTFKEKYGNPYEKVFSYINQKTL